MTESEIQKAVFAHLRKCKKPDVFIVAVANNPRSRRTAGFRKGMPDVMCLHEGHAYAMELKTEKGKPSEEQYAVIEELRRAGVHACIVYGLERAIACLEVWGLTRPRAS